jgi:hypothetical protein
MVKGLPSLAPDQDGMVAKVRSWAWRELVKHDETGVPNFLQITKPKHQETRPARAKGEVLRQLETRLKTPR